MDPLTVARYGLMAASQRFDASAARTARMGDQSSDIDYAAEAVEQIEAKHQFSANLGTIKVADEMWRSLMDIQTR
ncbi:flagellar basal body rod C-terminal domain-containing protein [Phenylobacterium soli]|uniref:Flagellar hook protein FlgE n=1 Tax=Phenylobacterium soli TaxID=2170551 RepID=A0A328A917_9CAUL|nr:flagellar basal body rod C-terminal domain-containing protein [Phenylobacterium soli]RAK51163.1 flagellar hook protein FlgE [Phenylobacterium soli]